MIYKNLGNSGLKVSNLSLGSWVTFGDQISYDTSKMLMYKAYEKGINFFDNAEVYSNGQSEKTMGNILRDAKWDRSTYVVSSKVFWGGDQPNQQGLSRKHIIEACNKSLERLRLDYLDLFFCHRPDYYTPIEETVRTMSDLIKQGKILYWGTSEWSAQEIMEAYSVARQYQLVPPTMEQPEYNMFHRDRVEKEYIKLYREIGLGTTIWSPLASGLLTGKYNNGIPSDTRANLKGMEWLKKRLSNEDTKFNKIPKIQALQSIASKIGTSLPCLSIAWCINNSNVSTAILGASKVSQLEENLEALQITKILDSKTMEEIDLLLSNKPTLKIF